MFDRDSFRENLNKYTRKAYQMIPGLDKPSILDVGCGSGVPTLELARLSNGIITAIDIEQVLLDRLGRKVIKAGLTDRITVINRSVFDLDFPDESFDIIWAEGSIYVMGFTRGLKEWKRFFKPRGYLVVHDNIKNFQEKCESISETGYDLMDHFKISRESWWNEYYAPLEKHVEKMLLVNENDSSFLAAITKVKQEIDMFKNSSDSSGSVYFVMQKK